MIKKKLLKSHSAQWLAGSTAALTAAHSANATVVRIDYIDHDLTQSLDGVTLFNGVADAGQWVNALPIAVFNRGFAFSSVDGASVVNYVSTGGSVTVGSYGGGGVRSITGQFGSSSGLIAWDLSNGTRGWLHVVGDTSPSLVSDYFVFDNADDQTRPVHNDNADAFTNAPTTILNAAVPEPSSVALLGLGAAGVLLRRRRAVA